MHKVNDFAHKIIGIELPINVFVRTIIGLGVYFNLYLSYFNGFNKFYTEGVSIITKNLFIFIALIDIVGFFINKGLG